MGSGGNAVSERRDGWSEDNNYENEIQGDSSNETNNIESDQNLHLNDQFFEENSNENKIERDAFNVTNSIMPTQNLSIENEKSKEDESISRSNGLDCGRR